MGAALPNANCTSKLSFFVTSPFTHNMPSLNHSGFQPATLLPPSLVDNNTYHSYTLPTRGKFSHRHSQSTRSLILDDNSRKSPNFRKSPSPTTKQFRPDHSPPNTRSTPQALLNQVSPKTPPTKTTPTKALPTKTSASSLPSPVIETLSEMADGGILDETGNLERTGSPDERTANSVSPSTGKYGGKTPGEIVTSALRTRRPPGALKKAMSLYQENRKQSSKMAPVPSGSDEGKRQGLWGGAEGRGHTAEASNSASEYWLVWVGCGYGQCTWVGGWGWCGRRVGVGGAGVGGGLGGGWGWCGG